MRRTITAVLACLLSSGLPAFAQDTEVPAEETAPASEELPLGEPVGPQIGQAYVRESFGDWALRCIKAPEGQPENCSLYQLLTNDSGQAVAEFNLFRLPPGGEAVAGANVVVPLETLLTQQLTIIIDGGNARRYPFTFCNSAGCVAQIGFSAEQVDEFKRGARATVRLVPAGDRNQEVLLTVSLSGFTAAYDATPVATGR